MGLAGLELAWIGWAWIGWIIVMAKWGFWGGWEWNGNMDANSSSRPTK